MQAKLDRLLDAWDAMDKASRAILVAQPAQLTAAAVRLERARANLDETIQTLARSGGNPPERCEDSAMPKFLLIEHAQGAGETALVTVCNTAEERLAATRHAMFGEGDSSGHDKEFDDVVVNLTQDGIASFEGDPSIGWLIANFAYA